MLHGRQRESDAWSMTSSWRRRAQRQSVKPLLLPPFSHSFVGRSVWCFPVQSASGKQVATYMWAKHLFIYVKERSSSIVDYFPHCLVPLAVEYFVLAIIMSIMFADIICPSLYLWVCLRDHILERLGFVVYIKVSFKYYTLYVIKIKLILFIFCFLNYSRLRPYKRTDFFL